MEEVILGGGAVILVLLALLFGFKPPVKRSKTSIRHALSEKGRVVEIKMGNTAAVAELQEIADVKVDNPSKYLELSAELARELYGDMQEKK